MSAVDVSKLPVMAVRANLGGSVLAVDGKTGASRLRYVPGEHLKNSVGTIFGGYLAAIVDDAAGITAWFGGGKRRFATGQLTVNFLRPVKPGDVLLADPNVIGMNERQ
ncbi:MAG: PaaI family thioesterase, partial [Vicinamibacteria bacterium]